MTESLRVVVPSRGRVPNMPLILRLLPGATVFVDKREESEYAAVVPRNQLWLHESLPGLVAIRNWLNANVQEDCLVMIDDDFRGVIPLMGKHRPITDPVVIAEVIANGHRVAEDLGISVFCWGRSLNNVLLKPEWDPFRLVGPISSSFGLRGAARSRRFDPACEIREDLDFTMQTLLEDRILLMEMRWYFDHGRIFSGRGGNVGLGKK